MTNDEPQDAGAFGLLLVQLGFHASARFAEALAPFGLEPRHAGMLRRLAANEGQSQQRVGTRLGITPTRMVFLVDDLEERGFVERRKNPADRRSNALHLTPAGHTALEQIAVATARYQTALGAGLNRTEQRQLTALLRKLATAQGINRNGLPGPPPTRDAADAQPV